VPTLPTYNAQRNITSTQSAPFRNEVDQNFSNQQKIIGTMADIAQKWSDANDVMQVTDAKAKYETAALDIQNRAFSDPDFNNAGKYVKELEDAKKNSLKGISNQQVSYGLGAEIDHSNQLTALKIKHDAGKKQIEYNKVQLGTNLDILQSKKLSAVTPAEGMQYQAQIGELINAQLKSGVITPQEAQKYLSDSTKKAYENLIYTNPQQGINILQSDNSLEPSVKGKLIQQAKQVEKRDKEFKDWQLKQVQTQSTVDLSQALHDGTLSPVMVRDMQQKGMIDSETAAIFDSLAINKKYDIPESTSLGQPEYFLRLLEDSHGSKPQVDKILKDAAEAYGSGKIGANQYRYFIQNAKETFERQSKGVYTKSENQSSMESAINGIKSFSKDNAGIPPTVVYSMLNKFFDRSIAGSDPNTIKTDVINEQILQLKPEVSTFPKEGKIMVDKNGNKAKVYPNGSIEEIK